MYSYVQRRSQDFLSEWGGQERPRAAKLDCQFSQGGGEEEGGAPYGYAFDYVLLNHCIFELTPQLIYELFPGTMRDVKIDQENVKDDSFSSSKRLKGCWGADGPLYNRLKKNLQFDTVP